jgi:hypothetical protein
VRRLAVPLARIPHVMARQPKRGPAGAAFVSAPAPIDSMNRELLDGTNMPVMEVAAIVGFDDPSGFAAASHTAVGVSPSRYRRGRQS